MKQKEKIAKALNETEKLNIDIKEMNQRINSWAKKLRFTKSLAITLIGFFGTILTLYIDKIRYGTLNLPSEWGWLQSVGLGVFLLIFFWGAILLSREK